jgi:hypothetical protein
MSEHSKKFRHVLFLLLFTIGLVFYMKIQFCFFCCLLIGSPLDENSGVFFDEQKMNWLVHGNIYKEKLYQPSSKQCHPVVQVKLGVLPACKIKVPSEVHEGCGCFSDEDHEDVHVSFATQQSKRDCIHGQSMMQEIFLSS